MISFRKICSLWTIVLMMIFVTSCGDTLTESSTQTFTQPQPVNTKTLLQFPAQLQGKYRSVNDSSFIRIGNNSIVRIYESWQKISQVKFDSSFVWGKDSVIEKGTEQKYFAIKVQDSVSVCIYFQDTVVVLNASTTLLKNFKGKYFLNLLHSNNNWIVKMFSISKGKLVLSSVLDSTEYTSGDVTIDTVIASRPQPLNLSKREFKRYTHDGSFVEKELFVRQ